MPKRLCGLVLLAVCCALLAGCGQLTINASTGAPDLDLIGLAPYQDTETPATQTTGADYALVDLWLDGTQDMGGVNPSADSLYPHYARRYREGGFHYRYGATVGWYENVLKALLGATDDQRVRMLRYGNEYLPDAFLIEQGLADASADANTLASLRRDLLTYALQPEASAFADMSAENMEGSFYQLGSPMLNQMNAFASNGGKELENPGKVAEMSAALDQLIASIAKGETRLTIASAPETKDCALLNALDSMDYTRLNIITVDPASIRRTSGTDASGKPVAYYESLLREKGVFDRGLCVGLYAMRLDYVGQIASVGVADLSEPIIWGKTIFNTKKNAITDILPMPRMLYVLVIGEKARVDELMGAFEQRLNADAALKALRGPTKGELTYTADGATVTQQPFGFTYERTIVQRPGMGYYTQHTEGMTIATDDGAKVLDGSPATVVLTPDASGKQVDRMLTIRFPLNATEGAALDLSTLQNARIEGVEALLLESVTPNTAENAHSADADTLAYRDKLYVYRHEDAPATDAFALLAVEQQGGELVCTVRVSGARLRQGYYRLRLCADWTGSGVVWPSIGWIDGAASLSASVSSEDAYAWETFAAALTKYQRGHNIPKNFQHAWGPLTDKTYHGLTVPDCPPVYKAIALKELADQLRDAATPEATPFVRCAVDVLVDNDDIVLR